MLIYHIVTEDEWQRQIAESVYTAGSLAAEGFIHCSYAEQIDGVLGRYYSGLEKVLILSIDTKLLTSNLVVEPSTGGEEYPHIYGPINRDAVVSVDERIL